MRMLSASSLRSMRPEGASSTARWSMRPLTFPSAILASSSSGAGSAAQPVAPIAATTRASTLAIHLISDLPSLRKSAAAQRHDGQVIEGGDRVRLGPQSDATGRVAAVAAVDESLVVEPALDAIARGRDAQPVPLAERRRLDARAVDLMPAAVVVVEGEVVFEGIGADDIVATVGEAEDDAAGRVLASRHRLEAHGDIDVAIGTARRDDHVEGIPGRALDERASAARVGHILDGPHAADDLPAVERLGEIEAALRAGGRGGAPDRQTGPQDCRGGDEIASRCAHDRPPRSGFRPRRSARGAPETAVDR